VVRIGEDVGRGAAVNRAVATLPPSIGLVAVAPADLVWPDGGDRRPARGPPIDNPRAAILAPRLRTPDGTPIPSAHPLPVPSSAVRRPPWTRTTRGPSAGRRRPRCCCGGAALDSVDGFDPRYPGRLDDLDLADRLARAGC
jgi:N-acetylglucosaminyl-diphospho-decaprenol L-rhamnosyltransferase